VGKFEPHYFLTMGAHNTSVKHKKSDLVQKSYGITFGTRLSGERRRCSNEGKTRNPLKFAGVPQTNKTTSAASGPKFAILWKHVEDIFLFNKLFSDCRFMP